MNLISFPLIRLYSIKQQQQKKRDMLIIARARALAHCMGEKTGGVYIGTGILGYTNTTLAFYQTLTKSILKFKE